MAVEFTLLLPLFLLILVALVEFGHLLYVQHVVTNASREGARYAVVYQVNYSPYSTRQSWAEARAGEKVNDYLQGKLPATTWNVTYPNPGSNPGDPFTVAITASKVGVVLGEMIPAFENFTVSARTTMRME